MSDDPNLGEDNLEEVSPWRDSTASRTDLNANDESQDLAVDPVDVEADPSYDDIYPSAEEANMDDFTLDDLYGKPDKKDLSVHEKITHFEGNAMHAKHMQERDQVRPKPKSNLVKSAKHPRRMTEKEERRQAAIDDLAMWSESDLHYHLNDEEEDANENNNGIKYSRSSYANNRTSTFDRGTLFKRGSRSSTLNRESKYDVFASESSKTDPLTSNPLHNQPNRTSVSTSVSSTNAEAEASAEVELSQTTVNNNNTNVDSSDEVGRNSESSEEDKDPDSDSAPSGNPPPRVSLFDTTQVVKLGQTLKQGQFLRFCYHMLCWHMFWLIYSLLIFVEPFLAFYNPYEYPKAYTAQMVIIVVNIPLLFIQLMGHLYYHKTVVQMKQNNMKITYWVAFKSMHWNTPLMLEVVCISTGVIFIWKYPGVALLRLFRAFRTLFYHDGKDGLPKTVLDPMVAMMACVVGEPYVLLVMKVLKFASYSVQNMGREIFYLTAKSKGGFILLLMMLFSAYVLGVTFWVALAAADSANETTLCNSALSCVFTMVRLSFFDGDGFDFAYSVMFSHPRLFVVLVVYFFLTAIGMANGLIGVFGEIFRNNSQIAFKTNKKREEEEAELQDKHDQVMYRLYTADKIELLENKLNSIELLLKNVLSKQLEKNTSEVDEGEGEGE